jgi:hypothetical protein
MDSLEVVSSRINVTTDLNSKQSLKWVMDLMFKHKRGNNPTNTYTTFLVIQQATKAGVFKGDSSIEFDTTGMLYIRRGHGTERHLEFTKNRRGESGVKLYYKLEDGNMVYKLEDELIEDEPIKTMSNVIMASIFQAVAKKHFKTNLDGDKSIEIVKEIQTAYKELN